MYKKVIVNLDIMPKKMYDKFMTFTHLQFKPSETIWEHYPKTGANNYNGNTMFNEAPIAETLLVLDYIKGTDIKPEFWYNTSLFIYNDDVYSIRGDKIVKVELDNTIFLSFREAFSHPFFGIFEKILKSKNGKLAKPNMQTMENTGCMNKFYALRELFEHREDFVGDFILPYSVKQNEMPVFLKFVQEKLGDKVVFKKDCIQEGKGVIFKDLTNTEAVKESSELLKNHKMKGHEILIAPAYEIEREYRCYFTNNLNGKQVFSIKQRVNSEDINVFEQENIQIYKNISVKWHEVKTDSQEFKFGEDLTIKMLEFMSYDTGTLEFARTKDNKIVFFEVNQMAGPLPFEGEDTVNINNYYNSMLDKMFS